MSTNSCIYRGDIAHERHGAHSHRFSYPIFMFALDLAELEKLKRVSFLFGHDAPALFTISDRDYLGDGDGSLRTKLLARLVEWGIDEVPAQMHLITMPKMFGYIFNPVSFYISRRTDGSVMSLVLEVNNTFGETHLYPLLPSAVSSPPLSFEFDKRFFVSPFFDVSGGYTLTLASFGDSLDIGVRLARSGGTEFSASLTGEGKPLTAGAIASTLLKFPLTSFLTMARIQKQAMHLHFGRGAPVYTKPPPEDPMTIRANSTFIHRLRLRFLALSRGQAVPAQKVTSPGISNPEFTNKTGGTQ